jgi:hypothetical protein
MTDLFHPEPMVERATPAAVVLAERRPDPGGDLPGPTGLTKPSRREIVARLLDPVSRYRALHDDLPALRSEMGPDATARLEQVLDDLFTEISYYFRERLRTSRDYGEYLAVINWALDDGEQYLRSDKRVYRHLALPEETLQRVTHLLRYRLISYLEIELCSDP